jgi:hypothetical protein
MRGWWNGVRVDATLIADNDQVGILVAPGQLLEVKLDEFARATTHALVAAHSQPPDRRRPPAAPP